MLFAVGTTSGSIAVSLLEHRIVLTKHRSASPVVSGRNDEYGTLKQIETSSTVVEAQFKL
jgi:hypothetical protein